MSRIVVANLFTTLDGAVENPHLWQGDAFDDVVAGAMGQALDGVETVLLGRKTYQMWAEHFGSEQVQDPFKDFIDPVAKHVVSRTLAPADLSWRGSTLVEEDLLEHVRALKQGTGGKVSVQGSLSVVAQLLRAGLLDRLELFLHPVFAGPEMRLTDAVDFTGGPVRMRLLEHRVGPKGTAVLAYGPQA